MSNKKRLAKGKHRSMERRLLGCKKPMSSGQKLVLKKKSEIDRERTKKDLESKRAAAKKTKSE